MKSTHWYTFVPHLCPLILLIGKKWKKHKNRQQEDYYVAYIVWIHDCDNQKRILRQRWSLRGVKPHVFACEHMTNLPTTHWFFLRKSETLQTLKGDAFLRFSIIVLTNQLSNIQQQAMAISIQYLILCTLIIAISGKSKSKLL